MKRFQLENLQYFSLVIAVLFMVACAGSFSLDSLIQKDFKQSLFKEADEALKVAREKQADIYAPETFKQGMNLYQEAEENLRKGKELKEIEKELKKAVIYFNKAAEATKLTTVVFSKATAARDAAMIAKAPEYDSKGWKEAEQKLEEAAKTLEEGDSNRAKSKDKEAETLYRKAELKAIKYDHLHRVWSLIEKATDADIEDRAPKTIKKACELAKEAEELLTKDRYDTNKAQQLANKAEYEVAHATYLSGYIKRLKEADKTFEDVLLAAERPIEKIADTLAEKVKFHQGMDIPTQNIVEAIRNLKDEKLQFAQEIQDRNSEISTLQEQFRAMNKRLGKLSSAEEELLTLKEQFVAMEKRLGELSSTEEELKAKVEQQRIWREKIARINNLFSHEEGNALLDGKNIIIRLYGLTFPVNKSEIKPQYFSLLTKVINAFAEFPDCRVIIEGHTDSQGSDIHNLGLSNERAKAVKRYILANTDIPHGRIKAVGYGESHPVANNETPEGRAKNRRIDVVIKPVANNEN